MRTVSVNERKWNGTTRAYDLHFVAKGVFHAWGLDTDSDETGNIASYSIAIVELSDGTIMTPRADLVKFNKD